MAKFKINREKCIRCGACSSTCPKGVDWIDEDDDGGKPEVSNHEELEKCGGEKVCPYGAIEQDE